jgi:TP901 family phage tail tape measure protein
MATAPVTVNANLNFNPASVRAAGNQVQSAFGNINLPSKAVNNFNNSLGRITGQASEFDKSINAATARVFAFGAAVSIINGISTAFKGLISSTIEVEKRLTEISSIIGVSVDQLGRFKTAIFDVAKNTGQTFDTVANGAAELARQGLSAEETVKRLNAALILTRVSGLDAEGSVSALTAAINGFTSAGLTAEQIINKLIAVDTAFAVSAKDLAEAFSRAGSTAEDAGVSFDQLLGLVTAVQQTTARGGAVIGNAFKSIFARLGRGTVIEDLKALGVEIDQSQTGVQKLQALATALANISDPTKANAIKELAGGVYQINIVSAALKDLSNETSIYAQASEIAAKASNEGFEKNAQLNQTLASQINSLVQGLTELGSKIGELTLGPVIQNLLTGANKLLDIFNKVFDPEEGNKLIQGFFKGIGTFIAGPGLVLVSAGFFKLFQVVAKFAAQGISDLFKIGSEQERIKNIEGGIVALLQQDANLRATLLSSSATQAQKEQAVINAIKQQNTLLTQQQALVNSIAAAAARAGVGGFTASGGFSGRGGKGRFAAGYMEEEAMARSLGATSSVKAKMGKGTIDGQNFIMNNQEVEIPNFAGGRDSAVIPLYAKGFVPNFNKFSTKSPSYFTEKRRSKLRDDELDDFDKALLAKGQKKQEDENRVGSSTNPLLVNASRYGYLIPNLNFPTGQQPINGRLKKKWNGFNVSFKTSRNPTFAGPKIAGEAKETTQDDKLANKLSESVMDKIVTEGYSYALQLTSPLVARPINKNGIKQRLGQEGNKGLFGAVQGAAGAAFEAAIAEVLSIEEAALKQNEGDFDAKQIPENLRELFKLPSGLKSADFKVSRSEGSKGSFIKKILNDNPDYYKRLLGSQKTTATQQTKASGFIPNFNSLNKGIPVNKIRAHFDGMGNPVAVTNTRDEPNGLRDAIGRENKGIGAYTENMAARGFVPNFIAGAGAGAGAAAAGVTSRFERMSGAIGALSSAYYFVGIPAIESMARAYALDEEALKNETDARDKAVKSLENERKKGEKANKEILTALDEEVQARNGAITKMNEAADLFASKTSDISNIIANGAFILNLIPFGKLKAGLGGLAKRLVASTAGRVVATAGSAAAGGLGTAVGGIAAAGVVTIAGAIVAALGAAIAGYKLGDYLYKSFLEPTIDSFDSLGQDIVNIQTKIKTLEQIDIPDLETDTNRYKYALETIQEAFKNGYEIIKITATGLRSEFAKLNDEVGFTGFDAKVNRSESADRLASSAQDVVTAQNLKGTRDPFEKQRIIKQREIQRESQAVNTGNRDRAVAAQILKAGQEDFLTGISKYFETPPPSLEEVNSKILIPGKSTIEQIQQKDKTNIVDKVFSTETDYGREGSTAPRGKDVGDAFQFTTRLEEILSGDQKNSQTQLFDALKRVTDASNNVTNSTPGNQEANLKEFISAQKALKPILQETAKKQGGEEGVEALNEEFDKFIDSFKSSVDAQTQSFIKENEEKQRINLDSLQKQKEVLGEFIDNFNASFLQNAQRGADLFAEAMASGSGTRIQENIAQLQGANLGTGMTGSSDVFAKRQEALIQIMSSLESSGFENIGTAEQQAAFKSKAAAQILGGGEITVFNDALGAQSGNLQRQLSAKNPDGTENVLGKQINSDPNARSAIASSTLAFKEILTKLREAAVAAGDTNLTADVDKRLATLSDPNATAQQKIAAGNIGLEGTKLEDAEQTEFQKQLISAGGVVQSVIDKLKGVSAATESDALGEQIKGVAEKLTTLQDALKITVDDVTLPTVIKEFTTSTQGLTPIVDAFKTKISELETESAARVELLKKYNTVEAGLLEIQETYQERQETLLGKATALIGIFEVASQKAKLFADNFPPPLPPAAPQ